jgi:hypothetical protein
MGALVGGGGAGRLTRRRSAPPVRDAAAARRRAAAAAALVGGGDPRQPTCSGSCASACFAYYLGNSPAADAYRAALRIPNILQNLFGEGRALRVVHPRLRRRLARGDERGGRAGSRGAVLALLALVTTVARRAGVLRAARSGCCRPPASRARRARSPCGSCRSLSRAPGCSCSRPGASGS